MAAVMTDGAPAREAAPAPAAESRAPEPAPPEPVAFHFSGGETIAPLLERLGVSLLVTTYQANKLLVIRARDGRLSILVRTFDRPMGVAADGRRLALGTREQVWTFRNAPDIAPRVEPAGAHDACYLPRTCHVTGDVGIHEVCWGGQDARELWLVNTRFSCLCTLSPDYSFIPRWRPPFVTALAAEDRCHLNGLAMAGGRPAFASALGETDKPHGWRPEKPHGGCLIEVPSGRVMARGLSMPHSPRCHAGKVWFLESGTGRLGFAYAGGSIVRTVANLPGFARGLALAGRYAFIGMSRIRATSAMDGVPLAQRREQLRCGVAVVDTVSGSVVAAVEFQTAVEEVFDVQLLEGTRFPDVMGFQKEDVRHTFVVPPERTERPFGLNLIS
jgi:uncharacterized protein (TIGR03032 family)